MADLEQSRARVRTSGAALGAAAAVVAAGVLWTALAASGGLAASPLADPGVLTRLGVPLVRVATDVAAVMTIGLLVVGGLLLPAPGGALSEPAQRLVRSASAWAAAWAGASLLGVPLVASDVLGVPLPDADLALLASTSVDLSQTRAAVYSAWLALLIALAAGRTTARAVAVMLLLMAVAAVLPPLTTGHVATHEDDALLGTVALLAHVLAAAAWVGGLVVLVAHLRTDAPALRAALPRYSALAGVAVLVVGGSGALVTWTSSTEPTQLWTTSYGRLVLLKVAALLLLAAAGAAHRRRTLPLLEQGRPHAFRAIAVAEVVVMVATLGLAVALSRTPPPAEDHGLTSTSSSTP